jgi:hypothetical protein
MQKLKLMGRIETGAAHARRMAAKWGAGAPQTAQAALYVLKLIDQYRALL